MTWLKGMLIALGLVVAIAIAIVAALGLLSSEKGREVRHISVGERTVSISHFKDFAQESTADGVKIVVDGHVVEATPDEITIDGAEQSIDPSQDVEITVDEAGKITAKGLTPTPPAADEMGPGGEASGDAPPE
jgi:hypothetical protein